MTQEIEVKICGLTNVDDVRAAVDCGADYLGFVLYGKSPRGVSAAGLAGILEQEPLTGKAVGVFVNESRAEVERIATDCGLCAVQIHGDEEPTDFIDMPVPVWRAVRLSDGPGPALGIWQAERYVVDAATPGLYGGSGIQADWDAAAKLAQRCPMMLAGGLTPDNVVDAVRIVNPLGVDVASGVESEPGKKDHKKLEAFIRNARSALSG